MIQIDLNSSRPSQFLHWCRPGQLRSSLFVGILLLGFVAFAAQSVRGQEDLPTDLSGFESSELFAVEDDTPLDPDDSLLSRLVYRTLNVSDKAMRGQASSSREVGIAVIKNEPQEYRFWVFHHSAVVTRAVKHRVPERVATPEFKEFWLLSAKVDGETCLVISKQIPPTWAKLEELDEPIEFDGFFFGLKSQEPLLGQPESVPVFVCNRVSWFPVVGSDEILPSHLLLAEQGVDLSALDVLRAAHGRRLSSTESRFFYQFLRAAKAVGESPDLLDNIETIEFLDLFRSWKKSTGQVVEIEGVVRRVIPLAITAERQSEIGAQQIYELDMYVPLDRTIKVRDVEYDSRFPVTVQMLSLPLPIEEMKGERIRVKGFFYRFWNYQSVHTREVGSPGQMAPLVIGFNPRKVTVSTGQVDFILTAAAILFLIVVVATIWLLRRSDNSENNVLKKKKEALPEQIDIKP